MTVELIAAGLLVGFGYAIGRIHESEIVKAKASLPPVVQRFRSTLAAHRDTPRRTDR